MVVGGGGGGEGGRGGVVCLLSTETKWLSDFQSWGSSLALIFTSPPPPSLLRPPHHQKAIWDRVLYVRKCEKVIYFLLEMYDLRGNYCSDMNDRRRNYRLGSFKSL